MASLFLHNWLLAQVLGVSGDETQANLGTNARDVRWSKPQKGWVKCNVDESMRLSAGKLGAGWVIRDEAGTMLNTCQVQMDGIFKPTLAEAMVFREALSWMKSRFPHHVMFESDSLLLIQTSHTYCIDNSYFGAVVQNSKEFFFSSKDKIYTCNAQDLIS
ncbi:hypothetical protein P3X46_012383 [Hevea brasiliensis]|uniref:RNase H type-1 domain-containing protein n=1 Tax=Hevea brasiliensis TaxID=3981 RepID=A0ABQ9MBX9_HEVBR|nr:hypothetical protein P3X46_012383 [Hevea brasiliensis]